MSAHRIRTIVAGNRRVFMLAFLLWILTESTGCCTLIGLGVGAAADHAKPSGPVPPGDWTALPPNVRVEVQEANGRQVQGRFVGMEMGSQDSAIVAVRTRSCESRIPASQIAGISRCASNDGKIQGLVVGFMLDCVVVAVAIHELEESMDWSSSWDKPAR